jgi:hypothetical protein
MAVFPYAAKNTGGRPYYRMRIYFGRNLQVQKNGYDREALEELEAAILAKNLSYTAAKELAKEYFPPVQAEAFTVTLVHLKNEGYWELILRHRGKAKATKYSRNYGHLLALKKELLRLREKGGTYEDACKIVKNF